MRWVLALLAVALFLSARQFGLLERLREPARIKADLISLGALGYITYIGAYTLFQPMGVPGMVFLLSASLVWPWPIAFAVSMAGTMGATVAGFSFARFLGRDWVSSKVPARFRRYDDLLERRGFRTVLVLRLIFWMPPSLHFSFGVSKVPFWTHFWASFLGYIPPLLLVTYFGQRIVDFFASLPLERVAIGIAVVVALFVTALLLQRLFRRR